MRNARARLYVESREGTVVRSGVFKVTGAFLAGLVVALASALVYVRTEDQKTSPVAKVEWAPVADPLPEEPAPPADAALEPVPNAAATAAPIAKRSAPPKHIKKAPPLRPRIVPAAEPGPPVQIVQNTMPAQPAYPPISQPASQPEVAPPATAEQQSGGEQAAAPHQVELAAGTALSVRLGETLSTEHNYTGDTFRGTLEQPIIRDGFIIAEKGSKVLGRILDATAAGRVRGAANLSIALTQINTTDGQRVQVETNAVEKRGNSSTGVDAAKIAGGAALGAIIGALGGGAKGAAIGAGAGGAAGTGVVLTTRGKPAVLPNESLVTFQLASPVTITEKLNR
jgi:hypothetical protein